MKQFYIFGGKSTALEIAETARLLHPDWTLYHVVGDGEATDRPRHFPISQLKEEAASTPGEKGFILSMADPDIRRDCLAAANKLNLRAQTLIHPRANCSPSATLGEGCYLAPGAVVSTEARVGAHTVLNYNVTFGHHARTGEHCILNPGAAVGGNVTLGERVLVGSNAFIFQGTTIGDDCQIDALTYIRHDLEGGHVAFGRETRIYKRAGFP